MSRDAFGQTFAQDHPGNAPVAENATGAKPFGVIDRILIYLMALGLGLLVIGTIGLGVLLAATS